MPRFPLVLYTLLGLALWPVPLLNRLHVESAAVVATVAFFVAGWAAIGTLRREGGASVGRVLGRHLAALGVPLALLTVAMLWAPNCGYAQGLLFYALFPGITVVLAVGLAYALTGTGLRRPRLVLVGVGLAVGLGGPVFDLGFHPQFYTYNHVFGGVLGPIYDEQLALRPGLFAFRALTLLWAGVAFAMGLRLRGRGGRIVRIALPVGFVAIALVYVFRVDLGLNTDADALRTALGGHVQTRHFDVYYDPAHTTPAAAQALAQDHERYHAGLRRALNLPDGTAPGARGPRIQSYVYPNPDVKARLTGARTTSVSPVWLATPQAHQLADRVDASLSHELAHVFSRPFGLPVIHATWAVGLVEGWAEALEWPSPAPSMHDLVAVAAVDGPSLAERADRLASRLSPWGFWTGRGAVSYATMGSFVSYLLDAYGPQPLKEVYATADFQAAYGRSLDELADGWAAHVAEREAVSAAAHDVVTRAFARPSLFETRCPHYVPPARRSVQAAERALRAADTLRAEAALQTALRLEPRYVEAHVALARIRLARGEAAAVQAQLDTLATEDRTAGVDLARGDASALLGEHASARVAYAEALRRIPPYAPATRAQIRLRDAVADRPAVIRILTGPDSAHVQAAQLERVVAEERPAEAVRAWGAVRWHAAHRYAEAQAAWAEVQRPLAPDRPVAWHRAFAIQQHAWQAEAAARTGDAARAHRLATDAAAHARILGATAWAESIDEWGRTEMGK